HVGPLQQAACERLSLSKGQIVKGGQRRDALPAPGQRRVDDGSLPQGVDQFNVLLPQQPSQPAQSCEIEPLLCIEGVLAAPQRYHCGLDAAAIQKWHEPHQVAPCAGEDEALVVCQAHLAVQFGSIIQQQEDAHGQLLEDG